MAFLVSPANPALKPIDLSSWHLINHAPFDHNFVDSFSGTSLHLSFTDYELPLDLGHRGLRDRQAVLLESVVTLNDRGKDLGDIDILSIFASEVVYFAHRHPSRCTHDAEDAKMRTSVSSHHSQLTTLDCWDELLDPPSTTGIFRATGNWQARIAAAAVCRQTGKRALILTTRPCLQCLDPENRSSWGMRNFDVIIA